MIPQEMKDEKRWVLWKYVERSGKLTKMPCKVHGKGGASSTNPDTWATYEDAEAMLSVKDGMAGVGFVLGDDWCGIDLDDCFEDGCLAPWARDVIDDIHSYSEISPSGEGVKIFCKGQAPESYKHKVPVEDGEIEYYLKGRYFTVTGDHLENTPEKVTDCTLGLYSVVDRYFGVKEQKVLEMSMYDIAKLKIESLPESISGEDGHNKMFRCACEIRKHDLTEEESWELLHWYNDNKCDPEWSQQELQHKWDSACKKIPLDSPDIISKEQIASIDLEIVPHQEFMDREYLQEYLIDGALVRGEHFVIGGPQKTIKTGILVDMAINLAAGGKFLGHFDVPEPRPSIIISGESGGATLQKTAKCIQDAYGVDPTDNLYWGLKLPNLSLQSHLDALRRAVEQHKAAFVAIDPAYLSLLTADNADSAANVFKMGSLLNGYGDIGKEFDCTMALVHHSKGSIKVGTKPHLANLSFAGFQEWTRQWLLLNHKTAYDLSTNTANLHMVIGGSAGHGGDYGVKINQGREVDPLIGRQWNVDVDGRTPEPEKKVETESKTDYTGKVVNALVEDGGEMSLRSLIAATGINHKNIKPALEELVVIGVVKETAASRGNWVTYSIA